MRFWRRRAGRNRDTWLTYAARFGYAACGIVYLVIGIAAITAALGVSRRPTGSHGVLHFFADLPLGPFALAALGVGLAGYAALNFAGALNDPERRGVTFSGLFARGVDVLTGVLYLFLAISCLAMIVDPDHQANSVIAGSIRRLLRSSWGSFVLWMLGIGLLISAGYVFYRAIKEPFVEMIDRRSLSALAHRAIEIAARVGTFARAVIFGVAGILAMQAAGGRATRVVADIGDALAALGSSRFGPVLLILVGTGFVAYGVYQIAKARYQRITTTA